MTDLDDPQAVAAELLRLGLPVHRRNDIIGTDARLRELFTAARRGGWQGDGPPKPRHINRGRLALHQQNGTNMVDPRPLNTIEQGRTQLRREAVQVRDLLAQLRAQPYPHEDVETAARQAGVDAALVGRCSGGAAAARHGALRSLQTALEQLADAAGHVTRLYDAAE